MQNHQSSGAYNIEMAPPAIPACFFSATHPSAVTVDTCDAQADTACRAAPSTALHPSSRSPPGGLSSYSKFQLALLCSYSAISSAKRPHHEPAESSVRRLRGLNNYKEAQREQEKQEKEYGYGSSKPKRPLTLRLSLEVLKQYSSVSPVATWFIGHGGNGFMVGLGDFKGHFQP